MHYLLDNQYVHVYLIHKIQMILEFLYSQYLLHSDSLVLYQLFLQKHLVFLKSSAIDCPIPCAPPVTTTTLSLNSIISSLYMKTLWTFVHSVSYSLSVMVSRNKFFCFIKHCRFRSEVFSFFS